MAKYSPEQRSAAVAKFSLSGLNLREFCRKNHFNYWTFRGWLTKSQRTTSRTPKSLSPIISFTPKPNTSDSQYQLAFADGTKLNFSGSEDLALILSLLRGRA